MLLFLSLICLASPLAATLPEVRVSQKDGHLQFKMPHFPGAKEVFIHYVLHTVEDKLLPKVGKAVLGGDGQWLWRELQHVLHIGDKVQYNAEVYGPHGKLVGPLKEWVYAPVATLGPRRTRAVVFRDDFDGGVVNVNNWDYEISMFGGMNWEFQVYVPDSSNVYTQGGNLVLKPTLTIDDPRFDNNFLYNGIMNVTEIWGRCTNDANYGCYREGQYGMLPPIMSGKLMSKPTLQFGRVEVRARIPKGDWIWPAIWMMPRNSEYGIWPRSGEIDIMESRGNQNYGITGVSSTLHWGTAWDDNHYEKTHRNKEHTGGGDWATEFHTWVLEWTPDTIVTWIDGKQILHVHPGQGGFCQMGHYVGNLCPWAGASDMAPFDKDFYLILNVAVGGTNGFFPDNLWSNKPWQNNSPQAAQDFWEGRNGWLPTWNGDDVAMMVDYVEFSTL